MAKQPPFDTCFNDWKRFVFVLREIASGQDGRPLSGFEAQIRAREVLNECGYAWWTRGPQPDTHPAEPAQQSSVPRTFSELMNERKYDEYKWAADSTNLRADYPRSLRLRR
jgi:hypothetical protein